MHLRALMLGAAGAVVLALPAPVLAAEHPPVGTRVRLTLSEGTPARRVIGVLQESNATTGFIQPDGSQFLETFSWSKVRAIDVSAGQHGHALEGLGLGMALGAGLGALVGYGSGDDPGGWFSLTAEEKAGMFAVIFGLGGGIAGLIVGATTRVDSWRPYAEHSAKLQPVVFPAECGVVIGVAFRP